MTESSTDDQSEWPERPSLFNKFSCGMALLVIGFSFAMAIAIVTTRNMPTEHTDPFWGPDVAKSIGIDRPVELLRPQHSTAATDLDVYNPGWIDMTELRDLGYFRRIFLADGNFDWEQSREMNIPQATVEAWPWAFVQFGKISQDSDAAIIAIELDEGWVGLAGGTEAARLTDSVRQRIAYRLRLFAKLPTPNETASD